MTDEYLTTAEAAVLLRYSQKTLRNKIAAGVFREGIHFVQKEGCQKRWKRSVLVAWLERGQGRRQHKVGIEADGGLHWASGPGFRGCRHWPTARSP